MAFIITFSHDVPPRHSILQSPFIGQLIVEPLHAAIAVHDMKQLSLGKQSMIEFWQFVLVQSKLYAAIS